jgi:transcriptional regulator with XRE-family HTH domain
MIVDYLYWLTKPIGLLWRVSVMASEGETMGQRFKRLREEAKMSQEEAALAADLPITTLRNWEQGRRIPRLDHAIRLARALRISLDALAGMDELTPEVPTRRKK